MGARDIRPDPVTPGEPIRHTAAATASHGFTGGPAVPVGQRSGTHRVRRPRSGRGTA